MMQTSHNLTIGGKRSDGTIYAGISPNTGRPIYTTPMDAPPMAFKRALEYAAKLDAHGHHDWRLPSRAELNVLFKNRTAIGGFKVSDDPPVWYWSSAKAENWCARAQRFSDGFEDSIGRLLPSAVRCIR